MIEAAARSSRVGIGLACRNGEACEGLLYVMGVAGMGNEKKKACR